MKSALQAHTAAPTLHVDDLASGIPAFIRSLEEIRTRIAPADFGWYPYGTVYNIQHLDRLLSVHNRDLGRMINGSRVADIGAGDGEIAFLLERHGAAVDAIDWPPTNFNGLRGVRALKQAMDSRVRVFEVDLDSQFQLPERHYGLVLLLGILYHLKNPFFVLEALARHSSWCLLSTRIARRTADGVANIKDYPLAYLVDRTELNNDATNYWIFSESGLKRLLSRTGWEIVDFMSVGNTTDSDPVHSEADERAFCLARSLSSRD